MSEGNVDWEGIFLSLRKHGHEPRHMTLSGITRAMRAIRWADLGARTLVAPAELPIGVVTAFIGAPFFLLVLRTTRGSS